MLKNYILKYPNLKVRTLCVNVAFGDPTAKQFERTLSWLNKLMLIYQKKDEELDIIY